MNKKLILLLTLFFTYQTSQALNFYQKKTLEELLIHHSLLYNYSARFSFQKLLAGDTTELDQNMRYLDLRPERLDDLSKVRILKAFQYFSENPHLVFPTPEDTNPAPEDTNPADMFLAAYMIMQGETFRFSDYDDGTIIRPGLVSMARNLGLVDSLYPNAYQKLQLKGIAYKKLSENDPLEEKYRNKLAALFEKFNNTSQGIIRQLGTLEPYLGQINKIFESDKRYKYFASIIQQMPVDDLRMLLAHKMAYSTSPESGERQFYIDPKIEKMREEELSSKAHEQRIITDIYPSKQYNRNIDNINRSLVEAAKNIAPGQSLEDKIQSLKDEYYKTIKSATSGGFEDYGHGNSEKLDRLSKQIKDLMIINALSGEKCDRILKRAAEDRLQAVQTLIDAHNNGNAEPIHPVVGEKIEKLVFNIIPPNFQEKLNKFDHNDQTKTRMVFEHLSKNPGIIVNSLKYSSGNLVPEANLTDIGKLYWIAATAVPGDERIGRGIGKFRYKGLLDIVDRLDNSFRAQAAGRRAQQQPALPPQPAAAAAASQWPHQPAAEAAAAGVGTDLTTGDLSKLPGIVENIGTFSNYMGLNGIQLNRKGVQAFPAICMLEQLDPELTTFNPEAGVFLPLTKLNEKSELFDPTTEKEITVTTQGRTTGKYSIVEPFYGTDTAKIPLSMLRQMRDSARVTVNQDLMPVEFYKFLLKNVKISTQDQRRVIDTFDSHATLLEQYTQYGFGSQDKMNQTLKLPLLYAACNVCHSQEIKFFVEQHLSAENKALTKMREVNFASARDAKLVLLSTPGVNLAYGSIESVQDMDRTYGKGFTARLISNMWRVTLDSAVKRGVRVIFCPAIGLGAFIKGEKNTAARIYFGELAKLLSNDFYGQFDKVYYNPAFPSVKNDLDKAINSYHLNQVLINYDKDVMYAAIEASKAGIPCALLNPSDPDVMWGVYNVGEYFFNRDYVGEEHIAANSTAVLGSRGICPEAYDINVLACNQPRQVQPAAAAAAAASVWPPQGPDVAAGPSIWQR